MKRKIFYCGCLYVFGKTLFSCRVWKKNDRWFLFLEGGGWVGEEKWPCCMGWGEEWLVFWGGGGGGEALPQYFGFVWGDWEEWPWCFLWAGERNDLVFMCGFGRGMTLFFCPANSYAEKVVRERFARAVARGLTELKIKKPTQSPINGLIQNAVIEVQICPCPVHNHTSPHPPQFFP